LQHCGAGIAQSFGSAGRSMRADLMCEKEKKAKDDAQTRRGNAEKG
jgi:hypothetical protein